MPPSSLWRALLVALLAAAAAAAARGLGGTSQWPERRRLIIGGSEASADEFPYLCSLRSYDGTQHVCGATLIAPQLALTAAYCCNPPGGVRNPLLWCGLPTLHDPPPGSFDALQTVRQTTHELYAAATYCHDLALLELNASAVHAKPIPGGTLQPGGFEALPPGHLLTAVGWGLTQRSDPPIQALFPNLPHRAELPLVPLKACNAPEAYDGHVIDPWMFCAGNSSADTCLGDSGGPLIDEKGSGDVQVGIVSWGAGCASAGFPGVYTRLDSFSDFITQHGYCGCSTTGLSGGVATGAPKCSAATAAEERAAGAELAGGFEHACYVVEPSRCPYAAASRNFPAAAVALCDPSTSLTGLPAPAAPGAEACTSSSCRKPEGPNLPGAGSAPAAPVAAVKWLSAAAEAQRSACQQQGACRALWCCS